MATPDVTWDPDRIVKGRRIWGTEPYSMCTDLLRYRDRWFCTFREGQSHWGEHDHGVIRIIVSEDGEQWAAAARLVQDGADLRDPKLSIMPDGRLMLICFRRFNPNHGRDETNFVYFSSDGYAWDGGHEIEVGGPYRWLWRVEWHEGRAYGITYGGDPVDPWNPQRSAARLMVSTDGLTYRPLLDPVTPVDYGFSESTVRFLPDGTAIAVSRTLGNGGAIGTAAAPYDQWQWSRVVDDATREADEDTHDIDYHNLGGPDLIPLPDGRIVVAGRYSRVDGAGTAVYVYTADDLRLQPVALAIGDHRIPRGDSWHCSYPGLVWHEDLLWMSYYHPDPDGRKAIYLARTEMPEKRPSSGLDQHGKT